MNPELMQMIMQLLGQGGGIGGQDLLGGGIKQLMGFFIDPNSGMGKMAGKYIDESISPWLRREMFGGNPLAGFGGPNSTWNPMTRMTQVSQQRFQKHMKNQMSGVIDDYNQQLLDDMIRANPELADSNTLNSLMIKAGTALTGASKIGEAFTQNAASFGYISGPMNSEKAFRETAIRREKLINSARALTRDFLTDRQGFGHLSGGDLGTLLGFEAERGTLDITAAGKLEGVSRNSQIKERMQKTARAISGIRDILTGPMPEVIKALESTFGAEAVNTFGIDQAANRLQQYKQMSMMTGVSVGQIGTYSAMAQQVSEQIAGHSLGAGQAGSMIAAFMSGGYGPAREGVSNVAGVDLTQFSRRMVARVTGAQQSATSLRVSAALNALRNQGATEDQIQEFRSKIMGATEPLTSESISQMTGGRVSVGAIESGRFSRGARDTAAQDSLGTMAAMHQTKSMAAGYRKSLLKQMQFYEEGDEKLSLRQLESKYNKKYKDNPDMLNKFQQAIGVIAPNYDEIAMSFGFKNDDELTLAMTKQEQAFATQKMAEFRGQIAQEFAQTGGGLGDLIQRIGKGEGIGDSFSKFMNVMKTGDQKNFMMKALGGDKFEKIVKNFMGDTTGMSKTEIEARTKVVQDRLIELGVGFDKDYNPLDKEAYANFAKDIEEKFKEEEKKGEYQLDKIAENITRTNDEGKEEMKGRKFKELNYQERVQALNTYTKDILKKKDISFRAKGKDETDEKYSEYLRDTAKKANQEIIDRREKAVAALGPKATAEQKEAERKKFETLYGEDMSKTIESGITKKPTDLLSELVTAVKELITKLTDGSFKIGS